MTDVGLFSLFLFLHVVGAVVAFGPTFTFAIIGGMGRKEPMHANFAVRLTEVLEDRVVIPTAITMPVTGVLLIYFAKIDLAAPSSRWLGLGIILYAIALSMAIFLQRPAIQKMVKLTSGGPPPGAGGPGGPPPGGPPPELVATAAKLARNGMIMGVLVLVIILLMVVKPQF